MTRPSTLVLGGDVIYSHDLEDVELGDRVLGALLCVWRKKERTGMNENRKSPCIDPLLCFLSSSLVHVAGIRPVFSLCNKDSASQCLCALVSCYAVKTAYELRTRDL